MGVIIRFPVIVVDQKATEQQYGITPQLCGYVSLTGSTSATVSEKALVSALTELSAEISGENVGYGMSIFDSISTVMSNGMNILQFNSLSGTGELYTTENEDHIYVNTYQAGTPGTTAEFLVTKKTLNGGANQVGANIAYNMTNPVQLMQVQGEWAIGKVLFKCTESFDSSDMMVSVGFDENPSAFILPFRVPSTATTTRLVDVDYGTLMGDKIQFVESSSSPTVSSSYRSIKDGQWVKAYITGADRGTRGMLKCVIFYDNEEVETL